MKQLTNDFSLQRIDLNPCFYIICSFDLSRFHLAKCSGIISQRFVFPLHARYKSRVSFLSYLFVNGAHRRRSRLLSISIANQPRRICSLKRWSIDSASLRPYLAACSARDWLLRHWRCIIKIKIGYCPGSHREGSFRDREKTGYRKLCQLRFGLGIVVTEIRLGGVPFGPSQMERLLCKQIQGRRWWIAAEEYPLPPLLPFVWKRTGRWLLN